MGRCVQTISRTRRVVVDYDFEGPYGVLAGDPRQVLMYENFNPYTQTQEAAVIAEAHQSQGISDLVSYRGHQALVLSSYVVGSGTATVPPAWMELLEICGYVREPALDGVAYYPGLSKSATMNAYLDGVKHTIRGVRGISSFSADAGGLASVDFQLEGIHDPQTLVENPEVTTTMLYPQRACGVGFVIDPIDAAPITPTLKSFSIANAPEMGRLYEASEIGGCTNVLQSGAFAPVWSVEIEWTPVYDFFKGKLNGSAFGLSMTIGSGVGKRIGFSTPEGKTAKILTEPKYGDSNNIRTISLDFQLLGERFIKILHH